MRQSAQQVDKLPPYSTEAEQSVLGCILTDPDCIDDCMLKFKAGNSVFYDLRHKQIYTTAVEMRKAGIPIDLITLHERLRDQQLVEAIGGLAYLSQLPDTITSTANLSTYIETVLEKYHLRKLLKTCTNTVSKIYEPDVSSKSLIGEVQNAFCDLNSDESDTSDGAACASGLITELERRFDLHNSGKRSGIATGFYLLDSMTDGLQYGELTIVGARPSVGKTALGLNIAQQVCIKDEIPTAIVTLEMSRDALMRRMLSAHANIPMGDLRSGAFTEGQFKQFTDFTVLLRKRPIYIIDGVGGMSVDELSASMRRLCRKHGIKLMVLDYLQRLRPSKSHEKKTYEVGEVSTTLKAITVELGIASFVLARLNRESEKEKTNDPDRPAKTPKLSDLADSGQIEYDGDLIALLHRQKRGPYANEASLAIAKQRDGELGVVPLEFNGQFCRFENQTPGDHAE